MDFIEILTQNPMIAMFSIILSPIGIILAVVFYLKSRKIKSIKHYFKSDLLIDDFIQKIEGLTIKFSDKSINRLMVTKIAFWNNGSETINFEDIPNNDKFSISIKDNFNILDVTIINILNKANNIDFLLSDDGKEISISFDYIDQKEGFIIQIFHTGTSSEIFEINGTIKGFGKIFKGKHNKNYKFSIIEIIQDIFVFIVSLSFSLFVIITDKTTSIRIALIIFIIIFIPTFLWKIITHYSGIPLKIRKYLNAL